MTFLEGLQSHRGGLLRLKSELFWYGGRGLDGAPGRICLLLDAVPVTVAGVVPAAAPAAAPAAPFFTARVRLSDQATVLLLIDGQPQWIWVGKEDVEIL